MAKSLLVSRFASDRSGQFAIIAAIMALPLLAGVGLAVDYAGLTNAKSRLRDANDAAALFAATQFRQNGELPDEDDVRNLLEQDFAKTGGEVEPVVTRMQLVGGKLHLESQVDKKMMLMGIFGHEQVTIPGSSVVNIGNDEFVEIAMALDTTASMGALTGTSSSELDKDGTYFPAPIADLSRMEALKYSASSFTTSLFNNTNLKSRLKISVVPFNTYVNVGTSKRSASWLDVPDDVTASGPDICYEYDTYTSTNCRTELVYVDGAQVPSTVCDWVIGPKATTCYKKGGTRWYGCVGSRQEPLNLRDSSPAYRFPGIMDMWCGSEILALNDNENAVLNRVNGLWPMQRWDSAKDTYIPEGVMWGLRTLSTSIPYNEGTAPTGLKKVRKILILMTDGDNQAVANLPGSPTHRSINPSEHDYAENKQKTDDWTLEACKQAIADGVEVFTISFGTDISAASRKLIQDCATDKDHYFDAMDGEQLDNAFKKIAVDVSGFYLAG